MNTGCFKCDKAQWDADGCTCKITGLLVGNAERGCEYRKDTLEEQLKDWKEEFANLNKISYGFYKELKEAKRLLKLATDTINHNSHKSCYNCSHFTSDCNCDIGKYLYGTGEKECEWEWKHMSEIINFLHD